MTVLILTVVCASPFVVGIEEEDACVVKGVSIEEVVVEEVSVEEVLVEEVLVGKVLVDKVLVEEVLVEEVLAEEVLDEEDVFKVEEDVAEVWEGDTEEAGAILALVWLEAIVFFVVTVVFCTEIVVAVGVALVLIVGVAMLRVE